MALNNPYDQDQEDLSGAAEDTQLQQDFQGMQADQKRRQRPNPYQAQPSGPSMNNPLVEPGSIYDLWPGDIVGASGPGNTRVEGPLPSAIPNDPQQRAQRQMELEQELAARGGSPPAPGRMQMLQKIQGGEYPGGPKAPPNSPPVQGQPLLPIPFTVADQLQMSRLQQGLASAQQGEMEGTLFPQESQDYQQRILRQLQPLLAKQQQTEAVGQQKQAQALMHQAAQAQTLQQMNQAHSAQGFGDTVAQYTDPVTGRTAHMYQEKPGTWKELKFEHEQGREDAAQGDEGASIGWGPAGMAGQMLAGQVPGTLTGDSEDAGPAGQPGPSGQGAVPAPEATPPQGIPGQEGQGGTPPEMVKEIEDETRRLRSLGVSPEKARATAERRAAENQQSKVDQQARNEEQGFELGKDATEIIVGNKRFTRVFGKGGPPIDVPFGQTLAQARAAQANPQVAAHTPQALAGLFRRANQTIPQLPRNATPQMQMHRQEAVTRLFQKMVDHEHEIHLNQQRRGMLEGEHRRQEEAKASQHALDQEAIQLRLKNEREAKVAQKTEHPLTPKDQEGLRRQHRQDIQGDAKAYTKINDLLNPGEKAAFLDKHPWIKDQGSMEAEEERRMQATMKRHAPAGAAAAPAAAPAAAKPTAGIPKDRLPQEQKNHIETLEQGIEKIIQHGSLPEAEQEKHVKALVGARDLFEKKGSVANMTADEQKSYRQAIEEAAGAMKSRQAGVGQPTSSQPGGYATSGLLDMDRALRMNRLRKLGARKVD